MTNITGVKYSYTNMKQLLYLFFFFGGFHLYGQAYINYSDTLISTHSSFLKGPITYNLHLPETFNFAAPSTKYPLIIIFDSQHRFTYPHIIKSLDLLTSESQMPESIIIGIPFDSQNRRYATSRQKLKADSLTGIERTERFLFEELIPSLQKNYKANDWVMLIGHSRTAFLCSYLFKTNSQTVDVAVALSGFYEEPAQLEDMQVFFSQPQNFPHPCAYYFTAGTTKEEAVYQRQCEAISLFLEKNTLPKNLKWKYTKTANANHMTNYWVSIPGVLLEVFSDYNSILDNWFATKLKDKQLKKPVSEFRNDLQERSIALNFELNPGLVHIFSLASHYANQHDYATAIGFIQLGKEYYPHYPEFDEYLEEFRQELRQNNTGKE